MHGPLPATHRDTVSRLFDGATLDGTLGTPALPGIVSIHSGERLLGTGGTFHEALSAATARARAIAAKTVPQDF